MSTTFVLICTKYPYLGGETFIHNEVETLASMGHKVLVYPISTHESDNSTALNNINHNVVVRNMFLGDVKYKRVSKVIRQLFLKDTWQELRKSVHEGENTIRKFLYVLLYEIQIKSVYDSIIDDIRSYVNTDERICFYSYWMHNHAAVALRLKAQYKNSIFISRAHGYDLYDYRAPQNYLPERNKILERADKVFTISKDGKDYLETRYPYTRHKVEVAYLGTKDYGLSKNNRNHDTYRIISCSNLVPVKRVDLIIDAISLIREHDIEWIHFGDGSLLQQLKNRASEKLSDNIKYHFTGHVDNIDILNVYKCQGADLFINVSESEGLPVSIMEAMSFGIPAIATNVGGTGEIVETDYNGWLLDKNFDIDELARMIENAINLPNDIRMAMSKNARSKWESNYITDKNTKKFEETVEQLFK